MNRLTTETRVQIVKALCEGCSTALRVFRGGPTYEFHG